MINETKDRSSGIPINDHQIYCTCFVDDAALLADDDEESSLIRISLAKFKPKINSRKIKTTIINEVIANTNETLGNEWIRVNEFCCLGNIITDDDKATEETKRRILLAK